MFVLFLGLAEFALADPRAVDVESEETHQTDQKQTEEEADWSEIDRKEMFQILVPSLGIAWFIVMVYFIGR